MVKQMKPSAIPVLYGGLIRSETCSTFTYIPIDISNTYYNFTAYRSCVCPAMHDVEIGINTGTTEHNHAR